MNLVSGHFARLRGRCYRLKYFIVHSNFTMSHISHSSSPLLTQNASSPDHGEGINFILRLDHMPI